jgi:uncharacterized membrane protein
VTTIQRYRVLNGILIAALFAGCAWAYPHLPDRIPVHFDLAGQPDRWAARSPWSWFGLPAIALVLALGMHAIAAWSTRRPDLWNVPDKPRFLALTEAERAPIVARMQAFLAAVSAAVTALFCALQWGTYRAATGASALPALSLAAIGAFTVIVMAGAIRLSTSVGRMIRDAEARRAPS